jgi:GntR family transcriptional repressor for pyruvate dehydrogenase complex
MVARKNAKINKFLKSKHIQRASAADEVFKILHGLIVSGKLKPGDMLPSQDKLAEHLSVSRNTVREALNKLMVMGLLTAKQGVGTIVNVSSPSSYMSGLSDHLLMDTPSVREFLEARVFVEKATVRLAVIRSTPEDIARMEEIISKQSEAYLRKEVDAFSKLDVEFHMALANASRNKVLLKFLETICELLHKFIAEVSLLPDAIEHAIRFHTDILEFIKMRDSKNAERTIVEHLKDVVQTIEKNLDVKLKVDFIFD